MAKDYGAAGSCDGTMMQKEWDDSSMGKNAKALGLGRSGVTKGGKSMVKASMPKPESMPSTIDEDNAKSKAY